MNWKSILFALLAGGGAGAIIANGISEPGMAVTVAPQTEAKAPDEIAKAAFQAGAAGPVICRYGVVSNHKDKVWCTDGGSAGFFATVDVPLDVPLIP